MQKNLTATQKFDTPAPVSVVLDVPAGHVRLIAADRPDTTVEILPANPSRSRDVRTAERTGVTYDDGTLRIVTAPAKSRMPGITGALEVTVQVPAGSHVRADIPVAELRGVGRLGDVTVEAAQGTVKLDETGAARLTLQAGDITLGRLGGSAELRTRKGNLTVTEAVRGTVSLRTESGDISVGAARGTSATLDAGTAYGRVRNTLSNTEGAQAALSLHATTSHGDITARSN
ncbi:DUF4097 family beta strand repeat-containing protein [Streptomyces sp. NPDC088789]|uniref:DUF4097 family beta strand repeat-containing protein n=1 Tax=Streptomyces sp. NPDC088789 TaxID=3365899 RepID=UPI0037FA5759